MASRRRSLQNNKQHEEKLSEERYRLSRQIEEEHRYWCDLIAEHRKKAKLTREQLAALAGISPATIRNIERGRCKSISQNTLNRLRSVSQLRLPLSLEDKESRPSSGYGAIWMQDYDPNYLLKLAHDSLIKSDARMQFSSLHHSKESIDICQTLISSGAYGRLVSSGHKGVLRLIEKLPSYIKSKKMDIVCLTVGHGWGEVRLAEQVLCRLEGRLGRIFLVSENIFLIYHGLRIFEKTLPKDMLAPGMLIPVLGQHSSFIDALQVAEYGQRQRLFCVLGTLMNIDEGAELLKKLSYKMISRDLLILDIFVPFGEIDNRKAIFESDPRFSRALPKQCVSAVEQIVGFDILASDPSIEMIEWSYTLDDIYRVSSNSMQAYSVHMNAALHRSSEAVQQVSCMRIHRHDLQTLKSELAGFGLILMEEIPWGEEYYDRYPCLLLLFVRK